ncbi:hypothetical protein WJX74_010984 [Apatococcus lobatus]|uniref:SET domain-containing protein n=1 Tax=Apatococcus lobatus TaxID=904363 RepID=A0AAW1RSR1_9CHLO
MNQQADLVVHSGLPAGYQTETRRLVRDCCKVVRVVYTAEEVGRGVAANCPISKGSLVEVSECILVPRQEYQEFARHTAFEHYLFHGQNGDMLLALGLGSLFNHSAQPNLDYRVDQPKLHVLFYAARDILEHEELFIFYGDNLWFSDTMQRATSLDLSDNEQKFFAAFNLDDS